MATPRFGASPQQQPYVVNVDSSPRYVALCVGVAALGVLASVAFLVLLKDTESEAIAGTGARIAATTLAMATATR